MVRLRSNRWYAADGRRTLERKVAVHHSGTRRVMSLCLLLGLVVVLMQQASDPRHVRQAFESLGVPLDVPMGRLAHSDTQGSQSAEATTTFSAATDGNTTSQPNILQGQEHGDANEWRATCSDIIPRIFESLSTDQRQAFSITWYARSEFAESDSALQATPPAPHEADVESSQRLALIAEVCIERAEQVFQQLIDQTTQASLTADAKRRWLTQLEQFREQWRTLCTSPLSSQLPASVSSELKQTVTDILDTALVDSLRDAAPWTQSESLAFWRLLQRTKPIATARGAATLGRVPAPLLSTLQLEAEADLLRGKAIRFRGTVRRVERIQRDYAPLNMRGGYWVVWLRGEDESLQPVALYTTDPGVSEFTKLIENREIDYPSLEVEAIFAKRLAYSSMSGLQVGPALFATKLIPLAGPAPPLVVDSRKMWRQFLIASLAACLLASTVLIPIVWGRGRRVHRQRSFGKHLLLWISTVYLSTSIVSDGQAVRGAPPWVQVESNPLAEFLTEGEQIPLSEAKAQDLRVGLANHSSPFPNTLLKMIRAVNRVGWTQPMDPTAPAEHNSMEIDLGEGLQLSRQTVSGWVRAASPVVLDASQRAWFQTDDEHARLYRIELQMPEEGSDRSAAGQLAQGDSNAAEQPGTIGLLSVYCESLPQQWLTTASLRQPAQFDIWAMKDNSAAAPTTLCALAAAPQWLLPRNIPSQELASQLAPALSPYLLQLGQLGWDLSYLETVGAHNQQPLSSKEAAGFYSLLRLAGEAETVARATAAIDGPTSVVKVESTPPETQGAAPLVVPATEPLVLLADPQGNVGRPLTWQVRIVTGTIVRVEDPTHKRQLGGNAYIQYDGFVDIGYDRIRFQPIGGASRATTLDFEGEFPVTIVAPWSASLNASEFAPARQLELGRESWSVGRYAQVHGRFYRLWSYQSELIRSNNKLGRQIAPLVVASSLVSTTPLLRNDPLTVGWFGWALCIAMLAILSTILWSATRKKRVLPA